MEKHWEMNSDGWAHSHFYIANTDRKMKKMRILSKNHDKEKDNCENKMLKRKDENVVEGKAGNFFPARPLRFL